MSQIGVMYFLKVKSWEVSGNQIAKEYIASACLVAHHRVVLSWQKQHSGEHHKGLISSNGFTSQKIAYEVSWYTNSNSVTMCVCILSSCMCHILWSNKNISRKRRIEHQNNVENGSGEKGQKQDYISQQSIYFSHYQPT